MSKSTGPQYLRDVAMGLRRMGFPISAPSLEQLAAQWEADRAALERARALAERWERAAEWNTAGYRMFTIEALEMCGRELAAALAPDGSPGSATQAKE